MWLTLRSPDDAMRSVREWVAALTELQRAMDLAGFTLPAIYVSHSIEALKKTDQPNKTDGALIQ